MRNTKALLTVLSKSIFSAENLATMCNCEKDLLEWWNQELCLNILEFYLLEYLLAVLPHFRLPFIFLAIWKIKDVSREAHDYMVSNIYPNTLYLRAYRNKTSQIAVFLNKYINSHVILYIFFILGEGRVIQK